MDGRLVDPLREALEDQSAEGLGGLMKLRVQDWRFRLAPLSEPVRRAFLIDSGPVVSRSGPRPFRTSAEPVAQEG